MPANDIELRLTLNPEQALAQFAKRAIFDTFRDRARDENEAYAMRDGLDAVARALGYVIKGWCFPFVMCRISAPAIF